jgi:hypothetical protein
MRGGRTGLAAAGFFVALLLPTAASPAAVTIGSNLNATPTVGESGFCPGGGTCTAANLALPPGSLAPNGLTSPIDGVVVRWRVKFGSMGNAIALRVLRPNVGLNFTGAGTSASGVTGIGVDEFNSQLPIKAGDFVGLNISNTGVPFATTTNATAVLWGFTNGFPGGLPDGALGMGGTSMPRELLLEVTVEPDCDSDGLGDETQDGDISACTPDVIAPETTITGGPKNVVKTKKKRAKVTFTFASSEPGTFECSLDGAPFTPCTSPSTHKVKAGRRKPKAHTFQVRAVDASGNTDGTPAVDDFKAKRKKKK